MAISPRRLKDGKTVYEIRVSRGRDPVTGKQLTPYSMRYTPPEGYSTKRALKEAQVVAAQFEADCRAGKVLTKAEQMAQRQARAEAAERERLEAAAKPTFKACRESWLKEAALTRQPGTIANYQKVLERAAPWFDSYRMEDITPALVKEYVARLFTESEADGKTLAYSTRDKHFRSLKAFFQDAVETEIIPFSPMQGVKRPRIPKSEVSGEARSFTAEEARYILACTEKEPLEWRAFITFMLDSGCRRGEVVGLMWDDLDMKTGKLTISRNAQYTAGTGTYLGPPKNGKSRSFFLNPAALAVMREWQREQALYLLKNGLPHTGFCFTRPNGEILPPAYPSKYFSRFGKKYNITDFHPHALRHTMATLAIANGADIISISKKLGHSSVSITLDKYGHANPDSLHRANKCLADVLYKQA